MELLLQNFDHLKFEHLNYFYKSEVHMDKKTVSKHDEYKKINDFSSRAVCVYNSELLMTKVKFEQLTEDYGFHQHYHSQITHDKVHIIV